MLNQRAMLLLAKIMLIGGAFGLLSAALRLFRQALAARMSDWHLCWIVPVAALVGVFKARSVMRRRMQTNVHRLTSAGKKQWPWQVFAPLIVFFIVMMILTMIVIKKRFGNEALALGIIAGVDLAVAVALVAPQVSIDSRRNLRNINWDLAGYWRGRRAVSPLTDICPATVGHSWINGVRARAGG